MVRLVGRERERFLLVGAVQELRSGNGGVVAVTGPAGIGKTSILRKAEALLESEGCRCRSVSVDEIDRRRSLGVVRSLLGELDLTVEAHHVDAAIAAAERIARDGPVAMLIDDVHWADDASLEALRAIGRRAGPLGVLLVVSSRPRPPSSAVGRLIELATVGGTSAPLRPLIDSELIELVRERLGLPASPELVSYLGMAGGNPFLATSLLDSLFRLGQIDIGGEEAILGLDASVPDTLLDQVATTVLGAVPDVDLLVRAAASIPGGG